ncbi:MAG: formate dehydrogenase accessory protein FdhE [Acidobacteriota bacterium]
MSTPPRERADSRELAALAELAEAQPELAQAVALEREILDGERRLQRRIGTPWVDVTVEQLTARLTEGHRLIDLEQLGIDWNELRLRIRQVVDVLRRHDVLDAADAARLYDAGRDQSLPDQVRQWFDAVPGAPSPGAPIDPLFADVLGLAARPFLVRAAEVLQQRVTVETWTHGSCPMCGATPAFAIIAAPGTRVLVCGRCHCRWTFASRTCHRCLDTERMRVFSAHGGLYQVIACDACKRYVKALDVRRAGRPLLMALDTVATLALDRAVAAQGFEAE